MKIASAVAPPSSRIACERFRSRFAIAIGSSSRYASTCSLATAKRSLAPAEYPVITPATIASARIASGSASARGTNSGRWWRSTSRATASSASATSTSSIEMSP